MEDIRIRSSWWPCQFAVILITFIPKFTLLLKDSVGFKNSACQVEIIYSVNLKILNCGLIYELRFLSLTENFHDRISADNTENFVVVVV